MYAFLSLIILERSLQCALLQRGEEQVVEPQSKVNIIFSEYDIIQNIYVQFFRTTLFKIEGDKRH